MTILSVDDSTTIRRIIRKQVTELGINLLEAGEGESALKILRDPANVIDMVVLDWNMPGMSGLDVLRQIRAEPRLKDVFVMMLTSEADQNCVMEALKAGAQNYMTKPFDAKAFSNKISEFVVAQHSKTGTPQ